MDVNLMKEKRVFLDTFLGELSIKQNNDGTILVLMDGSKIAIALKAENAFTIIKG